jgi:hypothetical protein
LPESPRFLIAKNRNEEAWAIIHRLHSDPNDPTDEFAKREFYQIYKQIQFDQTLKTGYLEILKRPSYRKRAFISIILAFCIMSDGLITIQSNTLESTFFAELWLTGSRLRRFSLCCSGLYRTQVIAFSNWIYCLRTGHQHNRHDIC